MGVKGLWKILKPACVPISWHDLQHMRVGVDLNLWLFELIKAGTDENGQQKPGFHLIGLLNRLSTLMSHNIVPVLVLDGPTPVGKRATVQQRARQRQNAINTHRNLALQLVRQQLRHHGLQNTLLNKALNQVKGDIKGNVTEKTEKNRKDRQGQSHNGLGDDDNDDDGDDDDGELHPSYEPNYENMNEDSLDSDENDLFDSSYEDLGDQSDLDKHIDPISDLTQSPLSNQNRKPNDEEILDIVSKIQPILPNTHKKSRKLSTIPSLLSNIQPSSLFNSVTNTNYLRDLGSQESVSQRGDEIDSFSQQNSQTSKHTHPSRNLNTICDQLEPTTVVNFDTDQNFDEPFDSGTSQGKTKSLKNLLPKHKMRKNAQRLQEEAKIERQKVLQSLFPKNTQIENSNIQSENKSAFSNKKRRRLFVTSSDDDDGAISDTTTTMTTSTTKNDKNRLFNDDNDDNDDDDDDDDEYDLNSELSMFISPLNSTTTTVTSIEKTSPQPNQFLTGNTTDSTPKNDEKIYGDNSVVDIFTRQDEIVHLLVKKAQDTPLTVEELAQLPLSVQYDVRELQRELRRQVVVRARNSGKSSVDREKDGLEHLASYSTHQFLDFLDNASIRQKVDVIRKAKLAAKEREQMEKNIEMGVDNDFITNPRSGFRRVHVGNIGPTGHDQTIGKKPMTNNIGNSEQINKNKRHQPNSMYPNSYSPKSSIDTTAISYSNNLSKQNQQNYFQNMENGDSKQSKGSRHLTIAERVAKGYGLQTHNGRITEDDNRGGYDKNILIDKHVPLPFETDHSRQDHNNYERILQEQAITNRLAQLRGDLDIKEELIKVEVKVENGDGISLDHIIKHESPSIPSQSSPVTAIKTETGIEDGIKPKNSPLQDKIELITVDLVKQDMNDEFTSSINSKSKNIDKFAKNSLGNIIPVAPDDSLTYVPLPVSPNNPIRDALNPFHPPFQSNPSIVEDSNPFSSQIDLSTFLSDITAGVEQFESLYGDSLGDLGDYGDENGEEGEFDHDGSGMGDNLGGYEHNNDQVEQHADHLHSQTDLSQKSSNPLASIVKNELLDDDDQIVVINQVSRLSPQKELSSPHRNNPQHTQSPPHPKMVDKNAQLAQDFPSSSLNSIRHLRQMNKFRDFTNSDTIGYDMYALPDGNHNDSMTGNNTQFSQTQTSPLRNQRNQADTENLYPDDGQIYSNSPAPPPLSPTFDSSQKNLQQVENKGPLCVNSPRLERFYPKPPAVESKPHDINDANSSYIISNTHSAHYRRNMMKQSHFYDLKSYIQYQRQVAEKNEEEMKKFRLQEAKLAQQRQLQQQSSDQRAQHYHRLKRMGGEIKDNEEGRIGDEDEGKEVHGGDSQGGSSFEFRANEGKYNLNNTINSQPNGDDFDNNLDSNWNNYQSWEDFENSGKFPNFDQNHSNQSQYDDSTVSSIFSHFEKPSDTSMFNETQTQSTTATNDQIGDGVAGTRLAFEVDHPGFTVYVPEDVFANFEKPQGQDDGNNNIDQITNTRHDYFQNQIDNENELSKLHTLLTATRVQALGLDNNIITTAILLAKLLGIEVIIGNGEADSTLAQLHAHKYIHSVITQDNDLVVRGADVIRNAFKRDKDMVFCRQSMLKHTLCLPKPLLLSLAIILGNDYAPGIHNVGPVQALELVSKFPKFEKFREYIDTIRNNPPHRWVVPSNFPSYHSLEAFQSSDIDEHFYSRDGGLLYSHSGGTCIQVEKICDMIEKESSQDGRTTRQTLARLLTTSQRYGEWVSQYNQAIRSDPSLLSPGGQDSIHDSSHQDDLLRALDPVVGFMLKQKRTFQTKLTLIPQLASLYDSKRMLRAVVRLRSVMNNPVPEDELIRAGLIDKKEPKKKGSRDSSKRKTTNTKESEDVIVDPNVEELTGSDHGDLSGDDDSENDSDDDLVASIGRQRLMTYTDSENDDEKTAKLKAKTKKNTKAKTKKK
jgi:hypothetical protein